MRRGEIARAEMTRDKEETFKQHHRGGTNVKGSARDKEADGGDRRSRRWIAVRRLKRAVFVFLLGRVVTSGKEEEKRTIYT